MQKTKKLLKVIHVPWTDRNPYQTLLAGGLGKLGVSIEREGHRHLRDLKFVNITFLNILVKHWKPDIIHVHWQHGFFIEPDGRIKSIFKSIFSLLQMSVIKVLFGVKVVWTAHNLIRHESIYPGIEKYFTRIFALLCDGIIAHCETAGKMIVSEFYLGNTEKLSIIPHGSFVGHYPNHISEKAAKASLDISQNVFTFLFFGEIRYYKGVLELIDAFKSLGYKGVMLVIAGLPHNVDIKKDILKKIKGVNSIRFIPKFVKSDALQYYINVADVVVFPYRQIFTSGGILLAMSFGKPIIAPAIGCINDLLLGTGNLLYRGGHKEQLLEAMKTAIIQKEKMTCVGGDNFMSAEKLSWTLVSGLTNKAYDKLLGG